MLLPFVVYFQVVMFSFVNNKIRGEIWFRMNCTHILLRFSNPIVCTRRGERGRKRRRIRLQVRAKRIARVDHFDNFINWLTSTTNLLHFVQFKSTLIAWSVAISMILLLSLSFDHLITWYKTTQSSLKHLAEQIRVIRRPAYRKLLSSFSLLFPIQWIGKW